jgi:hypothetical protein
MHGHMDVKIKYGLFHVKLENVDITHCLDKISKYPIIFASITSQMFLSERNTMITVCFISLVLHYSMLHIPRTPFHPASAMHVQPF